MDFFGWDFWLLSLFCWFGSMWKFFVLFNRFLYVMFWWISFFFLIWFIKKWGDKEGRWIFLRSLVKNVCFFLIFCFVYVINVLYMFFLELILRFLLVSNRVRLFWGRRRNFLFCIILLKCLWIYFFEVMNRFV